MTKPVTVWNALVSAYGGAVSDYKDFGDWMEQFTAYAAHEGGVWIEKKPAYVNGETDVFAMRAADGRIWDVVNGWRTPMSVKPTLADDLAFKPSTRRILAHLRKFGNISVLEAIAAYGTARIAPAIHDLRNGGYSIETVNKKDGAGHQYTRYVLDDAQRKAA